MAQEQIEDFDYELIQEEQGENATLPSDVRDHHFYVVFLKLDEAAMKHPANVNAAKYSGSDWIHCELYFPNTGESVSIDSNNPVYFMKNKNYTTREWTWISIAVTKNEYDNAYSICKHFEGTPFDKCALYTFWIPSYCCSTPRSKMSTMVCSRLCAHILCMLSIIGDDLEETDIVPGELKGELDRLIKATEGQSNQRIKLLSKMPVSIRKLMITQRSVGSTLFTIDTQSVYHNKTYEQEKHIDDKDLEGDEDEYFAGILV
jgi:hypothetical protein